LLLSIYQCDDAAFKALCALPLREEQKTEDQSLCFAEKACVTFSDNPASNAHP